MIDLLAAGARHEGAALCRPVVVTSPGSESHVLAAVRRLVEGAPEAAQAELAPVLTGLGRALRDRFDDPKADAAARAGAALDLLDAVRGVLDGPEALEPLLEALARDLGGARAELVLPAPGTAYAADDAVQALDVFSDDAPPGQIVALVRPGLRLAGALVRPALVRVSQGSPPPGILDEVLELLPAGDARADHVRARLQRARCLAAGDAGALLARELADLALAVRDDVLSEAARRALRLVIDEPPAALAARPGWEAVRELLDAQLETFFQDGENGELSVLRLVRPYLQGLRTGQATGARLRSLGEAMDAMLRLFDESLGAEARTWLFAELERLGAEGYPPGGHAQRLVRTAARALKGFLDNGEATAALELVHAIKGAGLRLYPEDPERLAACPDPTGLFHRLEAAHDEAERGRVLGEHYPAVAVSTADGKEVRETGSIKLSLGPRPKALDWLLGPEVAGSRLGSAARRLADELTRLDREKLLAELRGDADAERALARGVADLVTTALRESGWRRGDDDRAALAPLFELLRDELKVEVLPGYLSYRRLRELSRAHGAEVKVEVVREGARKIDLTALGARYRDELLAPLDMTWCTGPAPAYVAHLRKLPWFAAVLDGQTPPLEMPPGAVEAVRDFDSPDAQSLDGVVRSLSVLVAWLAQEQPGELDAFCQRVKTAPELEVDFFPLPGKVYPRERLLDAVDRARAPDALEVVRDAAREEGQAVRVERIGVYKDGRCLSDEPRAKFAVKSLPQAAEALREALQPVLTSDHVTGQVQALLRGFVTRMALVPIGDGQKQVELQAFKTLLEARLIDPTYPDSPDNALHKAGAYLAGRLVAEGFLQVERFAGKKTVAEATSGAPADSVIVDQMFCRPGEPELAEVRRPLVVLEGAVIQKAFAMKGVPTGDVAVLELDQVLTDTLDRLRAWADGLGAIVHAKLDAKNQALVPRTIQRIEDVREKMFKAHEKSQPVLPADTALRDLIRFVIDQVHRIEDALAILDDRSYRGAFGELVFKDIIFRSAGPYLSKAFGQSVDTTVVAGADTQALVGKFKKESAGPKPKRESAKIFSVVVPCYVQDGVAIRPATVRVGDF